MVRARGVRVNRWVYPTLALRQVLAAGVQMHNLHLLCYAFIELTRRGKYLIKHHDHLPPYFIPCDHRRTVRRVQLPEYIGGQYAQVVWQRRRRSPCPDEHSGTEVQRQYGTPAGSELSSVERRQVCSTWLRSPDSFGAATRYFLGKGSWRKSEWKQGKARPLDRAEGII